VTTPGRIRNWQQRKAEIAAEVAAEQERERRYQERIRALPDQPVHRFDKGRDPDAQDSPALERSVQWRQRAYAEAVLGERLDNLPPSLPVERKRQPRTVQEAIRRDRRENFLFWEWQLQQAAADPDALDWEPWNEVVATRGVLLLLAHYPRGEQLLRDLYRPHEYETMPRKEDAERFLDEHPMWRFEYTARGAEEFLAAAYRHVPGIQRAAFRVLAAYKRVVRDTWREEGRPDGTGRLLGDDDPQEPQPVTWDMLVRAYSRVAEALPEAEQHESKDDRAVMMYLQGVPPREAAQANGIGINRFYKILKERNIPVRRGPRKRKREAA